MNIHEYQAKALLKSFGAPVAEGVAIFSADEAEAAAKSLPGPLYVVKSQIHAGGCGKGKFKELPPEAKGGVRLAFSIDEAKAHAKEMLGNTLVTAQTGPAGKQVNRLYIEDGADIDRELYLSLLVDRSVGRIAFVVSTEGGMDIEAVAHDTPEKIVTLAIDPTTGVTPADVKKINAAYKLTGEAAKDGESLFPLLYRAFVEKDMSLLEVNPLIVMKNGRLRVLDRRQSARHRDVAARQDVEVPGLQPDVARPATEPIQEPLPEGVRPEVADRRHEIEVDDIGRVHRHEPVDVLRPHRLGSKVEQRTDLGLARRHTASVPPGVHKQAGLGSRAET